MSVLIKGMEMPTRCKVCMFCGFGGRIGEFNVCMFTGESQPTLSQERMSSCPLVPVPPHGRLIDIDAPYQIQVHVDGLTKKGGVDIYAPAVLDADWAEEGE